MNKNIGFPLLIIAASIVVLFAGLGSTHLWDEDEGFFASTAYEMFERGEWIVPYFNGEMFGHKPPWMYWMMMLGFSMFEDRELGARFFSAVYGTGTALLTFAIGRQLFNRQAGLIGGLVMSTSLMFTVVARSATADCYLVFFTTLSLFLYLQATGISQDSETSSTATRPLLPKTWLSFFIMYGVMGFGVLVKGPIGFLFPMAVIGLFLLCTTPRRSADGEATRLAEWREKIRPFGPVNFFRTIWQMKPLTAIIAILMVAGPWYLAVGLITDGAFLEEFFGKHHFGRFSEAMDDHAGSIFYYVVAVAVGMFPASVFAVPVGIHVWQSLRRTGPIAIPIVFLCCWAGVYIVIFSLAATKLPNYVLPAYPALALMIGSYIDRMIREKSSISLFWPSAASVVLTSIGVMFLVSLPLVCQIEFGGQTILDRYDLTPSVQDDSFILSLVGLPALIGGLITLGLIRGRSMEWAATSFALAAVSTMFMFWNVGVRTVDRHQTPQEIAKTIRSLNDHGQYTVAQFRLHRPSMPFYVNGRVEPILDVESIPLFLNERGNTLLVTTERHLQEVRDHAPVHLQVLRELPGFPKPDRIVLVAAENEVLTRAHRALLAREIKATSGNY